MPTPHASMHPGPGHAHDVGVDVTFDFLNTFEDVDGFPVDHLGALDDALALFAERGVIHKEGADRLSRQTSTKPRVAARSLDRIRSVRAALREISDAVAEHRAPTKPSIDIVNRALHARQIVELTAAPDGCGVDHRHVGDPVDDALARLAEALVNELSSGHPERIKICDNDTCRWIFYDNSRTGQRRWCDMATCGNRAKAARHRARLKDEASA